MVDGEDTRTRAPVGQQPEAGPVVLAALESVPSLALMVFDRRLRYLAVHGGAAARHGYAAERLVGRTVHEVLPPAAAARIVPFLLRALADEACTDVLPSVDGTAVYETTYSPVRVDGDVVAAVATVLEVTAERHARAELERTERLHELVTSNAGDVVALTDADGRCTWVSVNAERVTGWSAEQLVARHPLELVHPDDRARVRAQDQLLLDGAAQVVFEYRMQCPDDRWRWVESVVRPLPASEEGPSRRVVVLRDVDERRRLQDELRRADEIFALAFDAAPIGMALVAPDGRWLKVNPALCELTGRSRDELISCTFQDITHPDDLDADLHLLGEVLAGERQGYRMEKRYLRPDGTVVWVLLAVSAVREEDGRPRFLISQVEDIGQRKALEEHLAHEATHDGLTGLWNRSRLRDELTRCVADAARHSEPVALLLLDLDGFKAVNDRFGHERGDRVLRDVAAVLGRLVREGDGCARLGGDEFAVVLPRTVAEEAARVGERIVAAVADLPGPGAVSASIGLSMLSAGQGVDEWLHAADVAMYAAKRVGGGRMVRAGA